MAFAMFREFGSCPSFTYSVRSLVGTPGKIPEKIIFRLGGGAAS